jgi:putative methionine-R-sulfoxide reductase with GAF domain
LLVTQTATSPQRKPLLDEASFQQLLSAAFVLQEHNDRLRAKGFHADFADNLSAIVETQKLIQTLQLDLAAAAELVAERVQKISNASGTAIGILEKGELLYRAATGSAASDAGKRIAPGSALSADCLSRGSALNYPDVTTNLHVHAERFRNQNVKAFIAVPVYHSGQVAGVLELRFARANAFRESDVRSAELMAGLLSEAMVTAARMKWKEALASERQSMLEALERIKPQIERLGSDSMPGESLLASASASAPKTSAPLPAKPEPARVADTCPSCGSAFFDESESFCGICGSARPLAPPPLDLPNFVAPSADIPNKLQAPWLIPYGQDEPSNGSSSESVVRPESAFLKQPASAIAPDTQFAPATGTGQKVIESPLAAQADSKSVTGTASGLTNSVNPSSPELGQPLFEQQGFEQQVPVPGSDSLRIVPSEPVPVDVMATPTGMEPSPWGSARKTQQWLETVKTQHGPRAEWLAQQWQRRRANIYVVVAAVILLLVISGWGFRPSGTTAAGNAAPVAQVQSEKPAPPELTLFEKLMVSLGLAEAPPAPVYMGNPDTQVWVDVHTALYYCPGSDLYSKTADGRFSSQKDAQQDQFEPANRKACP